jgi:hypothetical protein
MLDEMSLGRNGSDTGRSRATFLDRGVSDRIRSYFTASGSIGAKSVRVLIFPVVRLMIP